ncbi:hypothetical protein [Phenylobacterium montanum]|uniref:Uncharacterized protein n=1 Tax=Phenylobacterium montanum TaxID=2823693 RepID=A0A975FXN5_9CAUL|nr:hypothetical protein [Caulobacter sp. S6]QUD86727.1 hypothetical protein KCG34_16805 [Caulobacter sp. S6]
MTQTHFDSAIEDLGEALAGPWRAPRQMLAAQEYDHHASIHDDATAQKLGFKGGTIEGPTHFSQFAPLGEAAWGQRWFEQGCISAHYRNAVFEGEEVRAILEKPRAGAAHVAIRMEKRDGTEVLRGTASVGPDAAPTALEVRLAGLEPLADPVILREVHVGMKTGRQSVAMGMDQHMGALYPFSLADKLKVITEPSPLYATGEGSPFGRPIIPMEMISVLLQHTARQDGFPTRGPVVGLFADQEIRLVEGPLFVAEAYELEREIVALSGSRRTESLWVKTRLYAPGSDRVLATMLLNGASMKESYAPYAEEHAALYGG